MKATKILALLMAVVMVFALAACAKTEPTPTTKGTEAANDTKTARPPAPMRSCPPSARRPATSASCWW